MAAKNWYRKCLLAHIALHMRIRSTNISRETDMQIEDRQLDKKRHETEYGGRRRSLFF